MIGCRAFSPSAQRLCASLSESLNRLSDVSCSFLRGSTPVRKQLRMNKQKETRCLPLCSIRVGTQLEFGITSHQSAAAMIC